MSAGERKEQGWETFRHSADIGIRGYGPSLARALEQAALALTAVVCQLDAVRPLSCVAIECASADPDFLLVDWINALILEMATRHMLFSRFEIAIDDEGLHAQAWGEPVDTARHQPAVEPKGATLTELRVARDAQGTWRAQCVVDV